VVSDERSAGTLKLMKRTGELMTGGKRSTGVATTECEGGSEGADRGDLLLPVIASHVGCDGGPEPLVDLGESRILISFS
jgi:hypothetical protein